MKLLSRMLYHDITNPGNPQTIDPGAGRMVRSTMTLQIRAIPRQGNCDLYELTVKGTMTLQIRAIPRLIYKTLSLVVCTMTLQIRAIPRQLVEVSRYVGGSTMTLQIRAIPRQKDAGDIMINYSTMTLQIRAIPRRKEKKVIL